MKLAWGMLVVALVGVVGMVGVVGADAKPKADPMALVLLIDRSGSMQGAKMDAAKAGAVAAITALADGDQVEVIAFDSDPMVAVPMTALAKDRKVQVDAANKIAPGGGTNFLPALQRALVDLKAVTAAPKHVILMTDGEAPSDGLAKVVADMVAAKITVSCVGVDGADRTLLDMIANDGHGRVYMVADVTALPKVFVREIDAARQGSAEHK